MHKLKNIIQNYQQTPTHTMSQIIKQTHYLRHPICQIYIIIIHYHYSHEFSKLSNHKPPNLRPSHIKSPIQHIVTQHPPIDDTYEQIIEQPKLDHSTDQTPTLPTSKIHSLLSHFLLFRHLIHHKLIHHQA